LTALVVAVTKMSARELSYDSPTSKGGDRIRSIRRKGECPLRADRRGSIPLASTKYINQQTKNFYS
jgi:hypothetical protein